MEAQRDFSELLGLLNDHDVGYVIVGGHALAHHGAPRYTGDIDILVGADSANVERLLEVLTEFGFRSLGLTPADFTDPDTVIQLGYPPVRVDIVTSITGVSWQEVENGKVAGVYGDVPVNYIGRDHLVRNKRATGRKKDLADLEALGEE